MSEKEHYCTTFPCPECGAVWQEGWSGFGTNTNVAIPWWATSDSTRVAFPTSNTYSAATGASTIAPVYWVLDESANVIRYYAGIDFGSTIALGATCSVASTASTSTVTWSYTTGTGTAPTQYFWAPEGREEAAPKLRSFKGSVAGKVKISE